MVIVPNEKQPDFKMMIVPFWHLQKFTSVQKLTVVVATFTR